MSQFTSLRWTDSAAAPAAAIPAFKKYNGVHYRWQDPASLVADSLTEHPPVHVHTSTQLQHLDTILRGAGQRYALVLDAQDCLVGVITGRDVLGRKSVQKAHELGVSPGELTVDYLMHPITRLPRITQSQLANSRIGDMVATLQKSGHDFLLVQHRGEFVALVAALNIVERTGESVQIQHHAHSFADLMYAIQHGDDLE